MSTHPIEIRQQPRQSMVMKATPDGVVVLIPLEAAPDSPRVQAFIQAGLEKIESMQPPLPAEPMSMDDLYALIDEWAGRIRVRVKRVQVRPMRRKWASCSTEGNLTVSDDLLRLPRRLAEYVVCHELVHLRIPDHGKGFRALMSCSMPDWREREQELAVVALKVLPELV